MKEKTMSQPYEIVVQETRIVTRNCLVEADSLEEAEMKAMSGATVAQGELQIDGRVLESSVSAAGQLDRGTSLQRVYNALNKPHAFTIHARIWGPAGLSDEAEYQVFRVDVHGRTPGIELARFPDGVDRRFVPATDIYGLRIESESDDRVYLVSDIRWDTDGSTAIVDLPEEIEVDVEADTPDWRLEDVLGEAITERTGWCHEGFTYRLAA
jgi:hypothetical protein